MKFECQNCGRCCREMIINICYSDIIRWNKQKRWDILREVVWLNNYPRKNTGGFYIHKTVTAPKGPCPFLITNNGSGSCGIHETKPKTCRDAPKTYDKFDICPAFVKYKQKIRMRVKKDQYIDFKQAHNSRFELLKILTEARHCGN